MAKMINRRAFLKAASAATVAWHIVPRHVLGRGFVPPSEKVNIAGIGIGGQGTSDLRRLYDTKAVSVVAICDPDPRRIAAVTKAYPSAKPYADYRKLLDDVKEVDGVVVATPDHHHAIASMEAIRRGKHVYCEKPLTHTISEARKLTEAAREAKVATQMGNQAQASAGTRFLCEAVWSNVIGPVREVPLDGPPVARPVLRILATGHRSSHHACRRARRHGLGPLARPRARSLV